MSKEKELLDLLDKILSRNLGWISSADSKISPLLVIDTALLGVLAALLPKANQWLTVPAIAASLAALLLIGSLVCLVISTFPRLKGPKGSLLYFGGIAEQERDKYIEKILSGITEELLKDFAEQCHRNAEIAKVKFTFVKWAAILLFSSLPVFFIAVALLYNTKQ